MKLTSLHALSHIEGEERDACGICDYALVLNSIPAVSTHSGDFQIENIEFVIQTEVTNNYNFIVSKTIFDRELLSRPPPSIV
ncbi:hypothetical protein KO500_07735 [Cellulophaga baltica]|uniref:hypothetical protein n=1 Tax=Cellulophaga TaxID=104264 RepID=UPI001C0735DC|nr:MULTISPECIES: hypothetical protein [Cellulophaga]MBU2996321.1 hypothetical protein [Cellulophaga baltica]MDO6767716.1 hypothetical protein [Cellulophaga sp. 1_MG-2023]